MKGAKRDKINSNPGLGCPEPQITSHRYIHRGSSLFDDDQPLTRLYPLPVIPLLIQCPPRDDSDVAEIRFQKTREIYRSGCRFANEISRIMPRSARRADLPNRALFDRSLRHRRIRFIEIAKFTFYHSSAPIPSLRPILIIFTILYRRILRKELTRSAHTCERMYAKW